MDRIAADPNVCAGKPVIRGTRIMVRNILGMVAGGYALDRVLQEYPELTPEDVRAALEYAANVIDEEVADADLPGSLVIVDNSRIRVRRKPHR